MLPQEAGNMVNDSGPQAIEPNKDIIPNCSGCKHLVSLLSDMRRDNVDCLGCGDLARLHAAHQIGGNDHTLFRSRGLEPVRLSHCLLSFHARSDTRAGHNLTPAGFESSSDFAQVLKSNGGFAGAQFRSLDRRVRNVRALGELLSAPAKAVTSFPDLRPGLHLDVPALEPGADS